MIYCTGCGKQILFTRPPVGVDKYFHDKACYMKWAKKYQEGEPDEKSLPEVPNASKRVSCELRDTHKV